MDEQHEPEEMDYGPWKVSPSSPIGDANIPIFRVAENLSVSREDLEHHPNPYDVLRANLERAWKAADHASYQPYRIVVHPIHYAQLKVAEVDEPDRETRIEMGKKIADAFDLPYWLVGIEGYKEPWQSRLRPAKVWRLLRYRVRRQVNRIPGVYRYGHVPREPRWGYDDDLRRRGRWWVQVGAYRLGWGWDVEDDEDW